MLIDLQESHLTAASDVGMDVFESFATGVCQWQRGCNWWIGDLARLAARRWPDTWQQIFPEWMSPDHIARCKVIAEAYAPDERNPLASWTIHMREAKKPDRIQRVAGHVDAGRTSDEAARIERDPTRWLIAVDVNYYLHRFWFSGAGVEAAQGVAEWAERTIDRLKKKGLTDAACCFDSKTNHRKTLTETWEDKYKPRPPKEPELIQQLHLVRELLEKKNLCCVSIDDMEADDIMASYAAQFDGRVTLFTQDKDARQCLSDRVNILLDIEWEQSATSGELMPQYQWLSAANHTEGTGLRPDQWTDYQTLMGDNVDGIKGCPGIGAKGATDLIQDFGTLESVFAAAESSDDRIKEKKREALLAFRGDTADVTRQLVTLKTDLNIPATTRLV